MADAKAAERACRDPNPIIDGRKANVNLAYLGAKPRGKSPGERDRILNGLTVDGLTVDELTVDGLNTQCVLHIYLFAVPQCRICFNRVTFSPLCDLLYESKLIFTLVRCHVLYAYRYS